MWGNSLLLRKKGKGKQCKVLETQHLNGVKKETYLKCFVIQKKDARRTFNTHTQIMSQLTRWWHERKIEHLVKINGCLFLLFL